MRKKKIVNVFTSIFLPVAFAVIVVAAWEMGGLYEVGLDPFIFPQPSEICKQLINQWDKLFENLIITVLPAIKGMLLGSLIGFLIAIIATSFPKWGVGGLTVVSAFNAVPVVALAPIMNNWFASNSQSAKVGVATIVCMAAMSINAYRGLNDLKPFSLDLMKSYAAKRTTIFFKLRFPNCVPNIFVALKINIASSMIATICAEYFLTEPSGIGFWIKQYFIGKAMFKTGWACILLASAAGILIYAVISVLESMLTKWHASNR